MAEGRPEDELLCAGETRYSVVAMGLNRGEDGLVLNIQATCHRELQGESHRSGKRGESKKGTSLDGVCAKVHHHCGELRIEHAAVPEDRIPVLHKMRTRLVVFPIKQNICHISFSNIAKRTYGVQRLLEIDVVRKVLAEKREPQRWVLGFARPGSAHESELGDL